MSDDEILQQLRRVDQQLTSFTTIEVPSPHHVQPHAQHLFVTIGYLKGQSVARSDLLGQCRSLLAPILTTLTGAAQWRHVKSISITFCIIDPEQAFPLNRFYRYSVPRVGLEGTASLDRPLMIPGCIETSAYDDILALLPTANAQDF